VTLDTCGWAGGAGHRFHRFFGFLEAAGVKLAIELDGKDLFAPEKEGGDIGVAAVSGWRTAPA